MPEEGLGLSPGDRQGCHTELLKSKLVGATTVELYKALGSKTEDRMCSLPGWLWVYGLMDICNEDAFIAQIS